MLLFHANVFTAIACLKHSHFLKVKVLADAPHNEVQTHSPRRCQRYEDYITTVGGASLTDRNPTTSFLTETTLIYAIGAGITAAAGTRLALQLILAKRCESCSFQLLDMMPCIGISCHYLPVSGLGNLRACCLP